MSSNGAHEPLSIVWNINTITNREWIAMERAWSEYGVRQTAIDFRRLQADQFNAVLWLFMRRDNPNLTVDEVLDLTNADYELVLPGGVKPASDEDDAANPPQAGEADASAPARSHRQRMRTS